MLALIKWAFDPPKKRNIRRPPWGTPWVMLSIHTEFHPIWSSRRDAVASPDLEIIDGIYCTVIGEMPHMVIGIAGARGWA